MKFDRLGSPISTWGTDGTIDLDGLWITGVAVAADGELVVATRRIKFQDGDERLYSTLDEFDQGGAPTGSVDIAESNYGLAIDAVGNRYLVGSGAEAVKIGPTGATLARYQSLGQAWGVAVDPGAGLLYATEGNGGIGVFDLSCSQSPCTAIERFGYQEAAGGYWPRALALDPSTDTLYALGSEVLEPRRSGGLPPSRSASGSDHPRGDPPDPQDRGPERGGRAGSGRPRHRLPFRIRRAPGARTEGLDRGRRGPLRRGAALLRRPHGPGADHGLRGGPDLLLPRGCREPGRQAHGRAAEIRVRHPDRRRDRSGRRRHRHGGDAHRVRRSRPEGRRRQLLLRICRGRFPRRAAAAGRTLLTASAIRRAPVGFRGRLPPRAGNGLPATGSSPGTPGGRRSPPSTPSPPSPSRPPRPSPAYPNSNGVAARSRGGPRRSAAPRRPACAPSRAPRVREPGPRRNSRKTTGGCSASTRGASRCTTRCRSEAACRRSGAGASIATLNGCQGRFRLTYIGRGRFSIRWRALRALQVRGDGYPASSASSRS